MDLDGVERRAMSSYMLKVSDRTDEETRESLNDFTEQYLTVDITVDHTEDDVEELVNEGLGDSNSVVIVVHRFDEMGSDMQTYLAQYLKGVAERYPDVPIVVFDADGGNLGRANPDLSGRVYSL